MKSLGEIAEYIGTRLLSFFEKIKFLPTPADRKDLALKAYESIQRTLIKQLDQLFAETEVVFPDNQNDNSSLAPSVKTKRQIYADPIVGWENFSRGCPGWGVLLSSYFDGVCEVVVLHDPLGAEEYSAGLQVGAFFNRHRVRNANDAEVVISNTSELPLVNCRALGMAYTAVGRTARTTIASHAKPSWEPMLLLLKEARVKISGAGDSH
jgi:fructose-1,6-bisphosphatase/inositol monophosphatase family enzyme